MFSRVGILRVAGGIVLAATAGTWLLVSACKSGDDQAPRPPGPPPAAVTAAALSPVFGLLASDGVAPQRLVIELARPIAESGAEEAEAEGTKLTITPEIDGELLRTSPSTLTFVPEEPFAPGTTYNVSLERIRTSDGKVLQAPGNEWRYHFTTPKFGLARFSLAEPEYNARWIDVDLVFSAAVDRDSVVKRANLLVIDEEGREAPLSIARSEQNQANVVRLKAHGTALRQGAVVRLRLDAGAEAKEGDAKAPAANAELRLPTGAPMNIEAIYPTEGNSGFYVEVVCNDQAVDETRYYWDQVNDRGFGELSARCQLTPEDLQERVHITPAVPFTTAPSGGGFRLFGDFKRGAYAIRIDAGAKTLDGGALRGEYESTFSIPARSAQVTFVTKGRYLPRSSWKALPVRHLNVDEVTVSVRQVPPSNLVFWMSNDESEAADERTSDLVVEKKIPVSGPADAMGTSYVDVASWLPADTKGLLEISLQSGSAHDSARLLLTDLQLVAKRTGVPSGGATKASIQARRHGNREDRSQPWGDKVHVWAFDSSSLDASRGVEVQLLRRSGKVLASCKTGASGACELTVPRDDLDKSPPFALLATSGKDLTYLKFADLEAEIEETRVAGEPYRGEKKYRAAVYGDRGVYRPGETAHLVALVRDAQNVAPTAGMPVVLKLSDPAGKVIRQQSSPVNDAGVVTLDPSFAAFASTGKYTLAVEVGDATVGSYSFRVEEFVPERMKVDAKPQQPRYLLGETVGIGVAARYLFGGIPAGADVELSCELAPSTFAPKQNANFVYGVWREDDEPEKAIPLGKTQGELGDDGTAVVECPEMAAAGSFRGPAEMVARAAVFEAGSGRTTVGEARVPVHPARYYVGLSSSAGKVKANSDLVVQGVVVDWDGKPVNAVTEVELELQRLEEEYGWYYDENLGDETYRRYLRPVPEDRTKVKVENGKFTMKWKPGTDASGFLVVARAGAARTDLKLEGDGGWYYWEPQESEAERTPRPDRPTWIDVTVPERAKVGDKIEVKLQAPFRGRVLLTAETDELLASEWKEVQPGELTWTFRLQKFVPNVYVTAFAVKDPRVSPEGGLLPDRAFGVQSVTVEPTEFTQEVRLSAPKEVRSASKLGVDLDLGKLDGPTWATVAVVDEGILSLTRFPSPDPAQQIFVRRGLGVETFETVGWTMAVPPGPATGGDAAGRLGRLQPVKPVALWSGLLQVPATGKLHVDFDLPAYRGMLRVMAVTVGPRRIGRADAQVVVRDPLVLQVTLPRFLALNDELAVPVQVTNLSGGKRTVAVSLAAEDVVIPGLERQCDGGKCPPLVEITGNKESRLELADGASGTAVFHAKAARGVGGVALVARATAGDLRSEERGELPVQAAGPRIRKVQRIEIGAGPTEVAPLLDGWVPMTERTTVWVTSNPYGEAFAHLKHLVHYPYGCIEQTTSTTRPLLYLPHLVGSLDPSLAAPGAIERMVQAGIERILSMQTSAGGFAYWPGGDEPAAWGTAYATHLLLDAQKLRYPVPQSRIDEALAWMEQRISNHYEKGGKDYDWYARTAEPYMHYVLAMAGKGRKGRILSLIESSTKTPEYEEREQLYMLQAALYLAGDHRFENVLRQPDVTPLTGRRWNSWTFYSDLRMRGFMLATFADLFGKDPAGERLANLVAEGLKGTSDWYTTQELAWGITGLGKMLDAGAKEFSPPVLTADGRRLAPAPLPPGVRSSDRSWDLPRASEYERLTVDVAQKGEGKLYLILVSQGVPSDGSAPFGGENLKLTRRFLDADGSELTGYSSSGKSNMNIVSLGDVVYVELTLHNTSGERMSNIALVDRLPAGFEIENPNLGRSATKPEWVDGEELWQADHMDLRDDRVEVFGTLQEGEKRTVVYAVRAVTAGTFALPTAEAEAMYDPRNWSRVHGGSVTVHGPWDDGE